MKTFGPNSISSVLCNVLSVADVLLIVAMALLAIGAAGYTWGVNAALHGLLPIHNARGTISMHGDPHQWPTMAAIIALAALWLVAALYIVRLLKKLFDAFRRNEPFRPNNADYLRGVWIAMAIMEALKLALFAAAQPPRPNQTITADLTGWFTVFVVMVLAEVFRESARLRREQDLTI